MNEIKKQKQNPIDSTWRKLDDLFEIEEPDQVRNSYREEYIKLGGEKLRSEFSDRYPGYSKYLKAHATDKIYQYCLFVGQHRLEMMCSMDENETPEELFFRTSPAHKVLLNLLCCQALKTFSQKSDHIGVEVSAVKKAMSNYVSDRTSAAILADAEDRGFINRRMASWNRRIPLVFVTPATLTGWIRFQLTVCFNSLLTSGLKEACEELHSSGDNVEETMANIVGELKKLESITT